MIRFAKIQVKGSSLLEVLVALAVITTATTLATLIYLNMQKSALPFFKLKATEIAVEELKEAMRTGNYTAGSRTKGQFTLKRSLSVNEKFPDCYTIRVLVFDQDKHKICDLTSVVLP